MSSPPVILISGTSRGLGLHLARHYLSRNAIVVGCSRGDTVIESDLYEHFELDVSDETSVRRMFREIRRRHGRLDVLINNAAVNPSIGHSMVVPVGSITRSFEVDLLAPMLLCRGSIALMLKGRFGRIINIGSMAVRLEVAGESVYTSMKAALTAYSRVLAKEIFPQGITCNVVSPSALPTEMAANIDPIALARVLERNAIPTPGSFEDVAGTIDWLIRPESGAVTGQVIYLGGV